MQSQIFKKVVLLLVIFGLILPKFAKFDEEDLSTLCQLDKISELEKSLSKTEYRKILEKCQQYYEQISSEIEKDITKTEAEKKTLQNKIYILKNKIKNLSYQIYQSNLMIKDLELQIGDRE